MKKYNKLNILLGILLFTAAIACISSIVLLCIRGISPKLQNSKNEGMSESAKLEQTFDYGNGYIKKLVFVGDMTISALDDTCSAIAPSQVWSGEDNTLKLDYNLASTPIVYSSEMRFPSVSDAAEIYKPSYMVITVGLDNGVGYCTEEKFKEYYIKLIDSVKESSPDTKIILQSVFPVSKSAQKADKSISNNRIRTVNNWILDICEKTNVKYLDTNSALVNEKGYLKSEFDSGDGIILNEAGYNEMLNYIRTHGYK